jgi:ATP-dependent Clp protease adaptor protein ClpS
MKSASATAESDAPTLERPQADRRRKPKRQPRYQVLLWDDDDHTYEYVIAMLRELFGFPMEKGYQLACDVDAHGKVICLTTTREHAELKRDQIHAYGRDLRIARCQGSMSSSIQPLG